MRNWRAFILLTAVLVVWPAFAGDVREQFDAANHLYDQGKFAEAAASYRRIIQSGHATAAVYFNLANSFVKSGQLGRAIANYRVLQTVTPRDPDLRANLRFALAQVQGPTNRRPALMHWLQRITLNEWALLTAAGFWSTLLLLGAGQVWGQVRKPVKPLVISISALTLIAGSCLAASAYDAFSTRRAIVVSDEAPVLQAPIEEATPLFNVNNGAELDVLDQNGDWLQVSAGAGKTGWIEKKEVLAARK